MAAAGSDDLKALERAIAEIMEVARGFGLDFYEMRFEICPADVLYTFGAYGMPTRFSHWSFGKIFHKMKTHYDYGLSKMYELVVNSDPCYAFLLEGNSLVQNKMIVAHVLAHCDFFKNNAHFARTNRDMIKSMSATAERIRHYEMKHGSLAVERFLDAALAVQEHVEPRPLVPARDGHSRSGSGKNAGRSAGCGGRRKSGYEDLWDLDRRLSSHSSGRSGPHGAAGSAGASGRSNGDAADGPDGAGPGDGPRRRLPPEPEKDLLLFLQRHSPVLEDWQRDVLGALRDEMLYFWPQLETKIMNEGWATYWHLRIMRELDLTEAETVEFAKLHAAVTAPTPFHPNPYLLGWKMFEDIERRWNEPTAEERQKFGRRPGQGREKMFEVRQTETDLSFLRNYLTKELVEALDLYVFERKGPNWTVTEKSWESVRDRLVASRINGGFPYLVVVDGDYGRSGELYIRHAYEGVELDLKHLEKTLPYVYRLWGKTVHLETVVENKGIVFSFDGQKHTRRLVEST